MFPTLWVSKVPPLYPDLPIFQFLIAKMFKLSKLGCRKTWEQGYLIPRLCVKEEASKALFMKYFCRCTFLSCTLLWFLICVG